MTDKTAQPQPCQHEWEMLHDGAVSCRKCYADTLVGKYAQERAQPQDGAGLVEAATKHDAEMLAQLKDGRSPSAPEYKRLLWLASITALRQHSPPAPVGDEKIAELVKKYRSHAHNHETIWRGQPGWHEDANMAMEWREAADALKGLNVENSWRKGIEEIQVATRDEANARAEAAEAALREAEDKLARAEYLLGEFEHGSDAELREETRKWLAARQSAKQRL